MTSSFDVSKLIVINYGSNIHTVPICMGTLVNWGTPIKDTQLTIPYPMNYTKLLRKAQLATTRKEARKILKKARKLELIENSYQLNTLELCCK